MKENAIHRILREGHVLANRSLVIILILVIIVFSISFLLRIDSTPLIIYVIDYCLM